MQDYATAKGEQNLEDNLSHCVQPSCKFQHVACHLPTRALCACGPSVSLHQAMALIGDAKLAGTNRIGNYSLEV